MFTYLGAMSDPCCMRLPQLCQKQLWRVNSFSSSSGSSTQGWGFSHSKGVSLSECLNSVSAPSILIEPPCINTSHIQCVPQCTEGFQWTDCQIVWNWMEFSEVRGKEKEVRRTEHFSAEEGMGSSQGSVCSVTQAYTWAGARDHLPHESSFHLLFFEENIAFFANMVEYMTTEYRATIFFSYLARRNMVSEAPR